MLTLAALLPLAAPAQEALAWRFSRVAEPGLAVELRVEAPGADSGETVFAVDPEWGGVVAGGEDLAFVAASGRGGEERVADRPEPHRFVVRHAPGERLALTLRLPANGHQDSGDPAENRRPIVNEGLFHAYGHLALPVPEHLDATEVRPVRFAFEGFAEAGHAVATSFGLPREGRVEARASLGQVRSAVYLAGELRLFELDVRGGPLAIALAGERWGFADEELVRLCGTIVETERAFFDERGGPFYLIAAVPAGPELGPHSSSLGGTGLTNSFSLVMNPDARAAGGGGMSLAELIAHELFHEWNGRVLEREAPEQLVYWFSEGFTNFYARRMLLRAGLIGPAEYAASVNEAVAAYLTSPVREAPNARVLEAFWTDREVRDLPYHRGDVVAMLLDHGIRRTSGGERSLDDLMRALVRAARAGAPPIETGRLLDTFAEWAGDELAGALRAVVVDGEVADVPLDLFVPCLEGERVETFDWELGFDYEATRAAGDVVQGVVPGSNAHAAGLRDGQLVRGWSVYHGDVEKPVELVVEEAGEERRVAYLPRGRARAVPRFAPVSGADCSGL